MLLVGAPLVYLLCAAWGYFGTHVRELNIGEEVTVTEISGCDEGGPPMSGQLPFCSGEWRFDDGRTGSGSIEGDKVAKGDKIYAGDGFVYRSRSSLIWTTVVTGLIGVVLLGMAITLCVLYRRLDAIRRRQKS
ncbi:hypothetical protein [Amycolatopsis alba]|uniref:DUF3592 domain-containing protein n=1 Tax=Amycolatopsis alba DSM 44262 TaxID=1125972 RepID=A0A229S729_AMYAL|nr:hypothetical protein [Amycolatopsis alba]OXM54394.1 hypothetical protein CFP75_04815 [Amycolatopsis alba DSM 44262]